MKLDVLTASLLVLAGVGMGVAGSHLPTASAAPVPASHDLSHPSFLVSVDEIRQNFVFGHQFSGRYTTTVRL